MSEEKKRIRQRFNDAVLARAGHRCEMCEFRTADMLDAHHITNRDHMPFGGYVASNGIALCPICHVRAEETYNTFFGAQTTPAAVNTWVEYTPAKLYARIHSSYDRAVSDSKLALDTKGATAP